LVLCPNEGEKELGIQFSQIPVDFLQGFGWKSKWSFACRENQRAMEIRGSWKTGER